MEASLGEGNGGKVDIWRDSYLRYLGYANELGESLRYRFPALVVPSYLVSGAYVLGDTRDKAIAADDAGKSAVKAGADVLIWQSLASVAVPGSLTINLAVKAAKSAVAQLPHLPKHVRKWSPTMVGLGLIPLIIHPIDTAVDVAMDATVRPLIVEDESEP
ncbi:unnamed protein product [Chrysoparadoxa australica]